MAITSGVESFLSRFPHHCEFQETWPIEGEMRVRLGLASELPPESVRSSILAILTNQAGKVVFFYPDEGGGNISRVLVGGRPEAGESAVETVIREVREETGWFIAPIRIIGYRHFHQTAAKAEKSDRPYPDFIQPIYSATTVSHDASAVVEEDFVPWRLLPKGDAANRIPVGQHPLLLEATLP